jgi:hypothetical protein
MNKAIANEFAIALMQGLSSSDISLIVLLTARAPNAKLLS